MKSKAPRFLLEFASNERKTIQHCPDMQQQYKTAAIGKIAWAVTLYEKGNITVNEAIDIINHPFRGICLE